MADTSYYEIVMTREQALFACAEYKKQRKATEKQWRVDLIHTHMERTTGFLGKTPKFKNVRECISYLKATTDKGLFSRTYWNDCCLTGSFWKEKVNALEKMLLNTEQQEVRLHSDMTFLTTYLK